jgi:hypothetical protein
LGTLLQLLRSPSHALRQQGEEVLQQNYHLRPPGALQVWLSAQHPFVCRNSTAESFSGRSLQLAQPAPLFDFKQPLKKQGAPLLLRCCASCHV